MLFLNDILLFIIIFLQIDQRDLAKYNVVVFRISHFVSNKGVKNNSTFLSYHSDDKPILEIIRHPIVSRHLIKWSMFGVNNWVHRDRLLSSIIRLMNSGASQYVKLRHIVVEIMRNVLDTWEIKPLLRWGEERISHLTFLFFKTPK